MCVVVLGWHQHENFPLVLAGNRDEFYARAAKPAAFWDDAPGIFAGRDMEGGGTWLGVDTCGRWAVVSNIRGTSTDFPDALSRGGLVVEFLAGTDSVAASCHRFYAVQTHYRPFNFLLGDRTEAWFCSTRCLPRMLRPGIYGLSNAELDCDWPKVRHLKSRLQQVLPRIGHEGSHQPLLDMLSDRSIPPDDELPDTGVGIVQERLLAPVFVNGATYGTRCSTVIIGNGTGETHFTEVSYDQHGAVIYHVEERLLPRAAN